MHDIRHHYQQALQQMIRQFQQGEHDIDVLLAQARRWLESNHSLAEEESEKILQALHRDLREFARSYQEKKEQNQESLLVRILRESIWKELADITDRSQVEWQEVFHDLDHHGVYHTGDIVGLGNLCCEHCHFTREVYAPEILSRCAECQGTVFHREAFAP